MNYGVKYQPRARREYQSALDWYHEKSVDAAINFATALKERWSFFYESRIDLEKYTKILEKLH